MHLMLISLELTVVLVPQHQIQIVHIIEGREGRTERRLAPQFRVVLNFRHALELQYLAGLVEALCLQIEVDLEPLATQYIVMGRYARVYARLQLPQHGLHERRDATTWVKVGEAGGGGLFEWSAVCGVAYLVAIDVPRELCGQTGVVRGAGGTEELLQAVHRVEALD